MECNPFVGMQQYSSVAAMVQGSGGGPVRCSVNLTGWAISHLRRNGYTVRYINDLYTMPGYIVARCVSK